MLCQFDLLQEAQHASELHKNDLANYLDLLLFQFFHGLVDLDDADTVGTR